MKKIYNIKIEPLTAVHIGTGETLTPLDYKIAKTKQGNTKYCKFSSDDIIARLIGAKDEKALREFEMASGSRNIKELQKFFHNNFTLDDLEYSCDVTKEFLKIYDDKRNGNSMDNALEVLQMYRPAGKETPVIPGSSIKGAIRTALLNLRMHNLSDDEFYSLNKKIDEIDKIENVKQSEKNKKYYDEASKIQSGLFNYNDAKNDPMRAVVVADFEFSDKNTQSVGVLNICSVDRRNEMLKNSNETQIIAEFLKGALLKSKSISSNSIIIDEDLNNKKNSQIKAPISMSEIVSACNYFFNREFKNEYEKFYKPCYNSMDVILELKKQIEEISEQKNQFLLRVGRWSQAEFVTFENYTRRPATPVRRGKPQKYGTTRTLLDYDGNFVPMGWCKCTVMDFQGH